MSIKELTVSGIKWSSFSFSFSFSFFVRRILAFLSNILYARLLSPDDFGLLAMASLSLGFFELFKDLGTGSDIIQRNTVSEKLLSSIFWLNMGFGLAVSAGLYFLSPAIAGFYRESAVTPLIQVLSFSFFISALSIVQYALLSKAMAFERQATAFPSWSQDCLWGL